MKNLYSKLLLIQKELGAIKKEEDNPFFKSKYFDINALVEHVKPLLNKHGLVLLQPLSHIDGKPALNTTLIEAESGESMSDTVPLPENIDPQKMGSAITYFRRYAVQSLLFLQAEDDDANAAAESVQKKTYTPDANAPQKILKPDDVMPFGKHRGTLVRDLPGEYIDWLNNSGGSTKIVFPSKPEPKLDDMPF